MAVADVSLTDGFAALTELATLVRGGNLAKKPRTAARDAGIITQAFGETFLTDSPDVPPAPPVLAKAASDEDRERARAMCQSLLGDLHIEKSKANATGLVGSWLSVFIDYLIAQIEAWIAGLNKPVPAA